MICVLLGSAPTSFAQEGKIYQAEDTKVYVNALRQLGVFDLYNSELFFGETESVKRHEAAKALVDYFGYDTGITGDVSHIFYDVPAYYEHSSVISSAYKMGIMNGVGGGLFAPEDNILTGHFIKAMVNTLGYEWKATLRGGYPNGYFAVAAELNILQNVTADMSSELTRGNLLKILYNTLEVPVCVQDGVSDDSSTFVIDENVTLLSYYHDIWSDTAIVNSNRTLSLNSSYDADPDKVLIGTDVIKVNNETISVFDYIGFEIDYFYRNINDGKSKELVSFKLTDSQNTVIISSKDVLSANSRNVTIDEGDRTKIYSISASADFFYNERPLTSSIDTRMGAFNGNVRLIDSDQNKSYDFCLITDYVYDEVTSVDLRVEKIYCESSTYNLEAAEVVYIQSANSTSLALSDIAVGNVIAVAKSVSGDCIKVVVMNSSIQMSVAEMSENGVADADGNEYNYAKSLTSEKKSLVALNKTLVLTLNEFNQIVWISEVDNTLSLGYLIKIETSVPAGLEEAQVRATILNDAGNVERYILSEKISIDGVSKKDEDVAAHLAAVKSTIGATGDGATSQVVCYRVDDAGLLKELHTADPSVGKIAIKFKVSDITSKTIQNQGNDSGVYDGGKYAVSQAVPIFRVPKTSQESYDDKFFTVTGYLKDGGPVGGSEPEFDGYVKNEDDVVCSAFVMYETATNKISGQASFFLVESVSSVANADGDSCYKLSGWYKDGFHTYQTDPSIVFPSELTTGDVVVFRLDSTNTITLIDKVYDYESDELSATYSSHGQTVVGGVRKVYMTHVYNAPSGSTFAEAYQSPITTGRPSAEDLVCLNFVALNGSKNVFTFDKVTKQITKGFPTQLQDWLKNGNEHAKVLVRYSYGYPQNYIIYQ